MSFKDKYSIYSVAPKFHFRNINLCKENLVLEHSSRFMGLHIAAPDVLTV